MSGAFSISELEKLHAFTCNLARLAGKYLREDQIRRQKAALATREKLNSVDLVTDADETVEKLIRRVCLHCADAGNGVDIN